MFYCAIQSDPALIWTYSTRLIRRIKYVFLLLLLFQGIARSHHHHQQTCQRAHRWVLYWLIRRRKKSFIKTFSLNSKQILRQFERDRMMIWPISQYVRNEIWFHLVYVFPLPPLRRRLIRSMCLCIYIHVYKWTIQIWFVFFSFS